MQPYKIANGIFQGTKIFKIPMKIQKTLNSHNNLKEKWSWRDQASYTAKVQWLKQNSMVQVQK